MPTAVLFFTLWILSECMICCSTRNNEIIMMLSRPSETAEDMDIEIVGLEPPKNTSGTISDKVRR